MTKQIIDNFYNQHYKPRLQGKQSNSEFTQKVIDEEVNFANEMDSFSAWTPNTLKSPLWNTVNLYFCGGYIIGDACLHSICILAQELMQQDPASQEKELSAVINFMDSLVHYSPIDSQKSIELKSFFMAVKNNPEAVPSNPKASIEKDKIEEISSQQESKNYSKVDFWSREEANNIKTFGDYKKAQTTLNRSITKY